MTRTLTIFVLCVICSVCGLSGQAMSQQLIESFHARLSETDHFNSNGERLRSVAAVIRQNRANFHRFGIRGAADEDDMFFASANNRALMERMLERGSVSQSARNAILNSTPTIRVNIFRRPNGGDFIEVTVY